MAGCSDCSILPYRIVDVVDGGTIGAIVGGNVVKCASFLRRYTGTQSFSIKSHFVISICSFILLFLNKCQKEMTTAFVLQLYLSKIK